ncbi:iron-sulfur cluster biosynthesis family protein [Lactobacillus sp. ESL0791]|uniref:iron-sulfur cluster biosynthesis family protein n=1 Tax=Lactobacillus sp. ESL0791 TaxID=2983234 RepID=UPI0023F95435|nr:iron-sulfur cluster biosynthesis family protein [Lactobacillus sp. ESL0791]MDF7637956.1 iron-sulfur cluster biosynthesis family protein [Lactobacillus sp. ESL0791]
MVDTEKVVMNIKPEAAEKIKSRVHDGQVVLLALNDGSNKYSKMGGTCTIGANFQFVVLGQKDPKYNIKIANNAGLALYTAEPEMGFLSSNLVVNSRNATLSLSDDSGVIDGGVTISDYEPSSVTAKDMQEGKTC